MSVTQDYANKTQGDVLDFDDHLSETPQCFSDGTATWYCWTATDVGFPSVCCI